MTTKMKIIKRVKPKGSGRKKGKPSKVIRVPNELIEQFEQVIAGNAYVKMKPKS